MLFIYESKKEGKTDMIDLYDANARAAIAFSLTLIVGLLTYIAFLKDAPIKGSRKSTKK